jgi:arsenate reductase
MAAAFFNAVADPLKARAISAGTQPGARVHPQVVAAMREVDLDLSHERPQLLTAGCSVGSWRSWGASMKTARDLIDNLADGDD